jgi:hypothetical protein
MTLISDSSRLVSIIAGGGAADATNLARPYNKILHENNMAPSALGLIALSTSLTDIAHKLPSLSESD